MFGMSNFYYGKEEVRKERRLGISVRLKTPNDVLDCFVRLLVLLYCDRQIHILVNRTV